MAAIVVVGGGVAGLACAWRLAREGHDVEVLEREAVPGGRMRTERHGDYRLDRGAQFVSSAYRNLHRVARELGLGPAIHPLENARNAVLRDGRLVPSDPDGVAELLRSPILSPGSKLRLGRLGLELLRHWRRLDPLRPERAAALDGEDLHRLLTRTVGPEARDFLFVPAVAATFDSEPEHLSGAFGLLVLRLVLGGFRLQWMEGGLGRMTGALAASVPVRSGCEALAVESEAGGARVRYRAGTREGRVVADAAVVAVPGPLVPSLCPKLAPGERGFFEGVRYAEGAIGHCLLEEPPRDLPGYGVAFPRSAGLELYGLAVDHRKPGVAPEGAGLVNAALTEAAAARLRDAPDDRVAALVLETLARTPVGPLRAREVVVHRWRHMLPQLRPGYLPRLAAFLRRRERSPRLAFAGDYLVGPFTEAALTSGLRAAAEIERALETTPRRAAPGPPGPRSGVGLRGQRPLAPGAGPGRPEMV